jgi:hypothetical protein
MSLIGSPAPRIVIVRTPGIKGLGFATSQQRTPSIQAAPRTKSVDFAVFKLLVRAAKSPSPTSSVQTDTSSHLFATCRLSQCFTREVEALAACSDLSRHQLRQIPSADGWKQPTRAQF